MEERLSNLPDFPTLSWRELDGFLTFLLLWNKLMRRWARPQVARQTRDLQVQGSAARGGFSYRLGCSSAATGRILPGVYNVRGGPTNRREQGK